MAVKIVIYDEESELGMQALIDDDCLTGYDLDKPAAQASILHDISTALGSLKARVELQKAGKEITFDILTICL